MRNLRRYRVNVTGRRATSPAPKVTGRRPTRPDPRGFEPPPPPVPGYYSPYPVLSTLRGQLGQGSFPGGGAPLSISQELTDLGLELPKMPKGLSDKEQLVWQTLTNIDIIGQRLDLAYRSLVQILGRVGAAVCSDLQRYNQIALDLYQVQQDAVQALQSAGVAGAPDRAPFPKLFVGFGAYAGSGRGAINCAGDNLVPKQGPNGGVRVQMGNPTVCPTVTAGPWQPAAGLGALPAIAWVGISLVVTVGGVAAIKLVADTWANVSVAKENTDKGRLHSEWLQRRSSWIASRVEECIDAGGDPVECLDVAKEAAPVDIPALRPDKLGEGHSWLWYAGWGALLLAAGGGIWAWRRRSSRRRLR